jgi:MFS family permease
MVPMASPAGTPPHPDGRVGYSEALAQAPFRALFAAQLVSIGGTSVATVALTVIVYRRSDSPLLASLTFAFAFLPYLFGAGLLSGIVDRVAPRRLVVGAATIATPLAAAMAWPGAPVGLLLALIFAIGVLNSLAAGGNAALVRASVPERSYVPARSLMRVASQTAQIGGNGLGGLLLVTLSPSGVLLLNAASFAFAAAALRLGLPDAPRRPRRSGERLVGDSLHTARTLLADPALRPLLLLGWLVPMFSVAPEALAAPYVAAHHDSAAYVGWWLVALPVGVIVGDVAGVRRLSQRRQRRLVAPVAAASFLPYLAFAADPPVLVAIGLLLVSGCGGLYALGLDGRLRDAASPELFARVMTLNSAGQMTLQGLGFALAGALAEATGAAAAVTLAGLVGLAIPLYLLRGDFTRARPRGGDDEAQASRTIAE